MNPKDKVAVAFAVVQIQKCLRICEKAGISAKPINFILIGLAGIRKEYREPKERP